MIIVLFAVAALVCLYTFINLSFLPKLSEPVLPPSLAICIPLRNEERNVEKLIHSLRQALHPNMHVYLYEDRSTDRTRELLVRLVGNENQFTIIDGLDLPSGWAGKVLDACHQLAQATHEEYLLFLDADITLQQTRFPALRNASKRTGGLLIRLSVVPCSDEVRELYNIAKQQFFINIDSYFNFSLLRDMTKVHPFKTLHGLHKKYFKDPQLIQALDRYATYIGSSPFQAPATFGLIAHLELNDGVYFTRGGNTAIAEGFARRARELGVTFRLGDEVTQIEVTNQLATEIELNHVDYLSVDFIVLNGDLLTQYPRLISETVRPDFKNPTPAQMEPSISAYVRCIGLGRRIAGLAHHNVFFSSDYEAEFEALFNQHRYAEEPTIYISNSSGPTTGNGRSR